VVAAKITEYLKATDRYAKTIVFCEDIDHAARMRQALSNANADLCATQPNYVVQITGDNPEGKRELDNFIDPEKTYPVIATTSKLMSTGVDAQTCKLIVLDQNIKSMTLFKQIIGRGTRLREDLGKSWFTILDFKRATEHFADPAFDGDPVQIYEPKAPASPSSHRSHRMPPPRRRGDPPPGGRPATQALHRRRRWPRRAPKKYIVGGMRQRGRGPRARAVPQRRRQAHHREPARLHPHQPQALRARSTSFLQAWNRRRPQGRADRGTGIAGRVPRCAGRRGGQGPRPVRPAAARGLRPAAAHPPRARPAA
jgi:hypothetical protein